MPGYNGYSSYEAWNVANEIRNDDLIYRTACDGLRHDPDAAAEYLLDHLQDMNRTETSDGVTYTLEAIREALGGLI